MRHATQAEVPFTLSEILEEEFREVHDCRGRFFEFHWNDPAHIAERLKVCGLRLADTSENETADIQILRRFSEFPHCDEEQRKAQSEEFAKAAAEAEAQIAQQDDARCKSYGRPGTAAYIDCRTSLKNDRADMKK